MLSYLTEQLNESLSHHGVVTDVILRSEHSLVEEEETREVEIRFMEREEEGKPEAKIYLSLLPDQESCEVEAEIAYASEGVSDDAAARLWEKARAVIPEISLTEKKRYLEPGKCVESSIVLDTHFIVQMPANEEEAGALDQLLERFSADLGEILRIGTIR
ncbi:hypothetical protein ACAF76_005940 [Brevibacillus sp. TJ4]|uniref:hypothetical protein n=1 Tax=Brevibacillus sp. TJ4 TaxID=3234853 RepID=UPI0037D77440